MDRPRKNPDAAEPRTVGGSTPRVLLLVPAVTYRAVDFLQAASRLGLKLVVASDGALPLGDRPVVRVEPDDLERSVDRLVSVGGPVDAVVAVDSPMLAMAAATAARLGLPHNPLGAVAAAADKAAQRRRWAAAGLAQPAFRVLEAGSTIRDLTLAAAAVGFPCVVKAVSLSGSQGVLRADDQAAAAAAASRVRGVLAAARRADGADHEPLLIEEYLPGVEISIDGLLSNGALTVTAVFDKPDTPDGPTFEETLLISPARLPEQVLSAAVALAEQAAQALGLRHGPIHAELRIDGRGSRARPVMLELAARSIGGLCSRALRFLGGVSLEELVLAHAVRRPIAPRRLAGPAGVLMLPVARAGVLRAVDGRAEAAAVPGVTGLSITIPVGQAVRPLPEGDRYLGFVFAEAETPDAVESALRSAWQRLRVVID